MAIPLLVDTDMGVDDAVALAWALAAGKDARVVGLTSVEGNVPLAQATANIARLLTGLRVSHWPPIGEGLSQEGRCTATATHVFGPDGLGESDLPVPADFQATDFRSVYAEAIEAHGGELTILAIGPLTNLAAVLGESPELLGRVGRIIVMGGAIWCKGNVAGKAEFNFHRDPAAAEAILSAGLPVTVVPLDVTSQVLLDESHLAHLSRSGTARGELLARLIRYPLAREANGGAGQFQVHDATALGVILRPAHFLRASMGLAVTRDGPAAGACRPQVVKDKSRQVSVAISVNAADLLEDMLETLCGEKFVV